MGAQFSLWEEATLLSYLTGSGLSFKQIEATTYLFPSITKVPINFFVYSL
jgi:hypothetical protein